MDKEEVEEIEFEEWKEGLREKDEEKQELREEEELK